ncbi:bifunctional 5,10-methylenetetrahydrofolate dehydrogenase/5,10-methenyltetrahydrofolate cyclohydrolase [Candidatus Woesearchaeota archaeon]|nr:bifunctional 5,10-methylenetetrahydrofolate dehydrogenase/5,10-methenyltetrahydrofolate cyclohydrolase [Candidatus Woesearchaeota archaeon]
MAAVIVDGNKIADEVKKELKYKIDKLAKKPGLAVILVGKNPASLAYVGIKQRTCHDIGIRSEIYRLSENILEDEIVDVIEDLNNKEDVHGILVQLPLPKHLHTNRILETIRRAKDVDGFTTRNLGKLCIGEPRLVACTPQGIVRIFEYHGIDILGKDVTIVNSSNVVGKPLALLLLQRGATITVCHRETKDLARHTREADIVITATGVPNLITGPMIKEGAIVIDAGFKKIKDRIVGDVDFEAIRQKASFVTPPVGGVGPLTVAMLMENTFRAYTYLTDPTRGIIEDAV